MVWSGNEAKGPGGPAFAAQNTPALLACGVGLLVQWATLLSTVLQCTGTRHSSIRFGPAVPLQASPRNRVVACLAVEIESTVSRVTPHGQL